MPFKKGTSGNPIGRPKGSVSTTTKLIREHISQAIDGNKIKEMLDKIYSVGESILSSIHNNGYEDLVGVGRKAYN